MTVPVLELRAITKRYDGNPVLKGVSLTVEPGEIHALVGENGAGKSTLMNIIFGMPVIHETGGYEGEVRLNGNLLKTSSPFQAMAAGVGMVHQEFMLIPGFAVAENVKLNREPTRPGVLTRLLGVKGAASRPATSEPGPPSHRPEAASHALVGGSKQTGLGTSRVGSSLGARLRTLDRERMGRETRAALDRAGVDLDEWAPVAGLSVGHMQFVEIAREIDRSNSRLIIFDEPTAVLTESGAQQMLRAMTSLAAEGRGILFITHRLDEILQIARRITVLRDGSVVTTLEAARTNVEEIAELMVGRPSQGRSSSHLGIGGVDTQQSVGKVDRHRDNDAQPMPPRSSPGPAIEPDCGSTLRHDPSELRLEHITDSQVPAGAQADGQVDPALEDTVAPRLSVDGPRRESVDPSGGATDSGSASVQDAPSLQSAPILNVRDLRVDMPGERVERVSFAQRAGEILGIAGLVGHGKVGIANGIMGLYPATGTVAVAGAPLALGAPIAAIRAGLAFVSEDRRGAGLLLDESVELNIALTAMTAQDRFLKGFPISGLRLFDGKAARAHALEMIRRFDIRGTGPQQQVRRLSGGNQQKVCLARAITLAPRVLLVSEPTRGIDVGAKERVRQILVELNAGGVSLLVTSSELGELREICQRILIIHAGRLVAELAPDAPDKDFGLAMAGELELRAS